MVDIYQIFQPTTRQYTFLFEAHGTVSKIDHILGHKASLNKFKIINIAPCIMSDHKRIKLDLNKKRKSRKYLNTWILSNIQLRNQWVTEVIRVEIKSSQNPMKMKIQNLWDTAEAVPRGKFIAISVYIKKTNKQTETSQKI
jgi:hypothetical protein